jgi:drug/metabolite transporter (DMT)-like permease
MKAKGYMYGAIAAASYGTNPLFALPLYSAGMDPGSVLFFRYLFAVPIMAVMIKGRGRDFKISRPDILPLVALGVLLALSSLTLFKSYTYMDVGIASTILFVYPILVALIMAVMFKEKMNFITFLCIALSLGGISLLYRTSDGIPLNWMGTSMVLISALTYAIYIVGVNKSGIKDMPTVKMTFYVLLFGTLFFFLTEGCGTRLIFVNKWYVWLNLLGLAVFPTAISFVFTTKAIQFVGSTPTAILGALEPVTAIIIGVSVFGEVLTARILIGILLVILSVTMIIAGGSISSALIRIRKMFPRIGRRNHKSDS